jgi:hypothetical protein
MDTYLSVADEQDEMAIHGQTMPPEPPVVERFGDGQWEMSTQSPHYNLVEGGHFGADALDEGTRLTAEQASLHVGDVAPDKVPEGFASYGHEEMPDTYQEDTSDARQESPPPQTILHDDQPLVENEDTISGDEVGVDDEEDEDVKLDEYAYGERIEEGDYDQRNYDIVSDDEEGLSEEDEEAKLEAEERYGNGEMYDEDGEGEWDEEEEDYESEESYEDEDDHDTRGYQPMRPAAPAPTGEPVVISLLSDSEDEDEPVPTPRNSVAAARAVAVGNRPTSSELAPSPEHRGSPGVLETVEMDSEKENVPDHIFGRTHVVDFATRAMRDANQHLGGPSAGMNIDTASSPFASQGPPPFEVSSARDESYAPVFEPAPSKGSSEGPFVSQPKAQPPAPSESSSEGLFISQPRHRSLDLADSRADDALTDALDETDEGSTDGDRESVPEQARTRDESSDVDEMEQDETATGSIEAEDDDDSLSDADDLSFASQVEMVEDLVESDDEYMSADDAPSNAADALGVVEEIAMLTSEEDVDMIDAGSEHIEPAAPEVARQSRQQEALGEASAVVSEVAVTEVVFEVTASATADEPLATAGISAQQEAEILSPFIAHNGGLPAAEPLSLGTLEGMPNGQPDPRAANSVLQDEGSQRDVLPVTTSQSKADSVAPTVQKHVQEPLGQATVAESQPKIGEVTSTEEASNEDVYMPDREADTDTQGDGAHPGSSSPSQLPTVMRSDETAPDDQLAELRSSLAEQGGKEKAPDEAEGPRQTPELDAAQQPTSPAAEDFEDDEVMLLEQLTQEHQQSFESQATEPPTRTRSPSPDLSVYLARQAVAARRNKKAPEPPARTSTRVTRARSSSLRSNATNGTPERDKGKDKNEDTSIALARAALASPSRRGHEADGPAPSTTTPPTIATLKSQLTKRLRTELPECVPLKSLSMHVDKFPNALAVVTSRPTEPARAKGGPREYFMSFRVTDPSVAPAKVVEVQLYRPHKDSLPVVAPGDVVLLQRFQVRAMSGKGWGLRTGGESAWAVWEGDAGGGDGGQVTVVAPQIRGPPVEDWEGYVGYVGTLREWFGLVMGDAASKGKLERADRKFGEAGGGGK